MCVELVLICWFVAVKEGMISSEGAVTPSVCFLWKSSATPQQLLLLVCLGSHGQKKEFKQRFSVGQVGDFGGQTVKTHPVTLAA